MYTDAQLRIGNPSKAFSDPENRPVISADAIPFLGKEHQDHTSFVVDLMALEISDRVDEESRTEVRASIIAGVRLTRHLENILAERGLAGDAVTGGAVFEIMDLAFADVVRENDMNFPPQGLRNTMHVMSYFWRYCAAAEAGAALARTALAAEAGVSEEAFRAKMQATTEERCDNPYCAYHGAAVQARLIAHGETVPSEEEVSAAIMQGQTRTTSAMPEEIREMLKGVLQGLQGPDGAMPGVTIIKL